MPMSPVTFRGETRTIVQWAAIVGLGYQTIRQRLLRGYTVRRALNPKLYNVSQRLPRNVLSKVAGHGGRWLVACRGKCCQRSFIIESRQRRRRAWRLCRSCRAKLTHLRRFLNTRPTNAIRWEWIRAYGEKRRWNVTHRRRWIVRCTACGGPHPHDKDNQRCKKCKVWLDPEDRAFFRRITHGASWQELMRESMTVARMAAGRNRLRYGPHLERRLQCRSAFLQKELAQYISRHKKAEGGTQHEAQTRHGTA